MAHSRLGISITNGDGVSGNVSVALSPIRDSDGRIIGVSKIARDITERVQAEQRIRQLVNFDALTGLPNRRAPLPQGGASWQKARKT